MPALHVKLRDVLTGESGNATPLEREDACLAHAEVPEVQRDTLNVFAIDPDLLEQGGEGCVTFFDHDSGDVPHKLESCTIQQDTCATDRCGPVVAGKDCRHTKKGWLRRRRPVRAPPSVEVSAHWAKMATGVSACYTSGISVPYIQIA